MNSKTKIILLVGEMAAGKSTIEKALAENMNRIISYTTRKKRKDEVDGLDYHFITNEEFDELYKNGNLYEKSVYEAEESIIQYGVGIKSFSNEKDNVGVVNVDGLITLSKIKELADRIIGIHIVTPVHLRKERFQKRDGQSKITETIKKRIKRDERDFQIKLLNFSFPFEIIRIDNDESVEKTKAMIIEKIGIL